MYYAIESKKKFTFIFLKTKKNCPFKHKHQLVLHNGIRFCTKQSSINYKHKRWEAKEIERERKREGEGKKNNKEKNKSLSKSLSILSHTVPDDRRASEHQKKTAISLAASSKNNLLKLVIFHMLCYNKSQSNPVAWLPTEFD